jgi:hypothetical protein
LCRVEHFPKGNIALANLCEGKFGEKRKIFGVGKRID